MNQLGNIIIIANELSLKNEQVQAVAKLLSEDATVPFIARYRKEVTGNLDEVAIIAIRDRFNQLDELDKRKEAILKSLKDQDKLTPELEKSVNEATVMSRLEDIYLPYKPKRKTRGSIAKEKGLEPLAEQIFFSNISNPENIASKFIDFDKGIKTTEDALQGARDIMAEWINENIESREIMRSHFAKKASLTSKVVKGKDKDRDAWKYRDYFDWSEKAMDAPSHRILALLRGSDEGFLSVHFLPEEDESLSLLEKQFMKGKSESSKEQIAMAVKDSYKRLLGPSMETEIRSQIKKRADEDAIFVFGENVRELLLASPLGQKTILAIDPGLRTGCKLVILSRQGNLLYNTTIYPIEPHNKKNESAIIIKSLCQDHGVEAIAIGNGTGGRETLAFCKDLDIHGVIITMVDERGASVYSASAVARKEFPHQDITVRGAVSIGRRLMDPLAELIKIDPKSIGVGLYQHDVNLKALKKTLDDVVMSCVNSVGVEVNTASGELLKAVSGLSPRMADAIVKHRTEKGPFKNRDELKDVPSVGPKAFEQAVGFLRIRGGNHPLDGSAVHPESYHIVEKMAADLSCTVETLMIDKKIRDSIDLEKYVTDSVGMPTLKDIIRELEKPGRDPRKEFELFSFKDGVNEISDLKKNMVLPGVVTNVTSFGAFIDIGVHQDGLVHISHLSDTYVSDPHSVVKVNQKVQVTVLEVEIERKRISLSMKTNPFEDTKEGFMKERKQSSPEVKKTTKSQKSAIKKDMANLNYPASPFGELRDILKK